MSSKQNTSNTIKPKECYVYRLGCSNEDDRKLIRVLASRAKKQAEHFKVFNPWESDCREKTVMYVAVHIPPLTEKQQAKYRTRRDVMRYVDVDICGWMNVDFHVDHAYISTIVSRARTNRAEYARTGVKLIEALEADVRALGLPYISLLPYGDIEAYYAKLGFQPIELWGAEYMYKPMRPNVRPETFVKTVEYMSGREIMDLITKTIPDEYKETLKNAIEGDEFQTIVDIYLENEDIEDVVDFLESI